MSAEFIELSAEEMDGLIERIEGALRDGLSLESADISLILKILRHFAFMQGQLQGNDVMKQKYLKLLGLFSSSETQQELFDQQPRKRRRITQKPQQAIPARAPKICHHQLRQPSKD